MALLYQILQKRSMTNERREDLYYYLGGLKTQLDAGD